MLRGIFALLGLVLAIGLSVIPAFSQTPPNPFRVATEATFPPFEFQQGGQLTGFDIDLMRAIGKEADLNIDFRNLPFDGIIPALQARTVEAAISGMTITAERAHQDSKHGADSIGGPNMSTTMRLVVMGEEYGEVCRAVLDGDAEGFRKEVTQLAACCVAMLERAP